MKKILRWKTNLECGSDVFTAPTNCVECFFSFPQVPYSEEPEFSNNLVLGSAGMNYFDSDGNPQSKQQIFRINFGHQCDSSIPPHINKDFGFLKKDKNIRRRIASKRFHTIKIPKYIEFEWIDGKTGERDAYSKIDLKKLKTIKKK